MTGRALIEVDFPLKEVGEESVKEKNIRHGHISTFHVWWARRPLAASRSTMFACLVPEPADKDELKKRLKFLTELCKWENSLNHTIVEEARKQILEGNGGRPPKVLDCFSGGGSIPLEAMRLGCETWALEYNPVAVLLLKAMIEYPSMYASPQVGLKEVVSLSSPHSLVENVRRWGDLILQQTRKEIGGFYPVEPDSSVPIGYIWARTVKCNNPSCGADIPLLSQLWLAKKKKKQLAIKLITHKDPSRVDFRIVAGKEIDFDPSEGTTSRATVLCMCCGSGLSGKEVRRQFVDGRAGQRMIVVVLKHPDKGGKHYRLATGRDVEIFEAATSFLEEKRKRLREEWGFDPLPDELGPPQDTHRAVGSQLPLYGHKTWSDLFNSRQKLALMTFVENVRYAHKMMLIEGVESDYAKAVTTYLGLAVDELVRFTSVLNVWKVDAEAIVHVFGRQTLAMTWDYTENNPLGTHGGTWYHRLDEMLDVVLNLSFSNAVTQVLQGTATRLPYPDGFFDAVVTDPPYYDNVPYADLSDFFYVWLKRALRDLYPNLLTTSLTPKSDEIIQNAPRQGGNEKAKIFFEDMITKAFKEIHRVLKEDGIACIVFAHKSTDAWETIINALLNSGLYLTSSWPIHTEMKSRLEARGTASLASSVYMVCRKRRKEETVYFNQVKEEVIQRVRQKLDDFWQQGISGADFFVSAIGPAVEVFGRYSKVERFSGETVSVRELLDYVRKVVSEYALARILRRPDLGGVDATTRFYLLWRWTFNNSKVHFNDARLVAQSVGGVELTDMWGGTGIARKEKEFVRVLDPRERSKEPSFAKREKLVSMIDVLHRALALWESGDRKKIEETLEESGFKSSETFWQVAQAISEVLPSGDKEKQMLQGFLYGKSVYLQPVKEPIQGRLD